MILLTIKIINDASVIIITIIQIIKLKKKNQKYNTTNNIFNKVT